MAYQGVLNDIRACVKMQKPERIPVFAMSEEFDVKWHGKYTYEEVATNADKLVEVWSAAIKEFDYDWAWIQLDDCIEFEVLGVGCVGSGNILRATRDYLPAEKETLKNLKMPDPEKSGRMPMKLEAIRRLKDNFGDTICVVGGNAAPYTSAGLLYGLEKPMTMMFEDPDLLKDTIDFFVELQTRWGLAQIAAGADAIWLGDCNAFSGMLSPKQYREFAFTPCQKVVAAYKKAGGMTFLHNSEISLPHIALECELGADVISIGPGADFAQVKAATEGKTCIMGNLDPIEVLLKGSPELVAAEVERIMAIGKKGAGYIFDDGEMIPRDVPVENMRALMKTAKALSAA
ncbi:MAG: uroporphyrinogen decarboxylase family protein [Candidatus Omnitrophica bacterium]|nr:uroporphyrinogen decarboxylase family protein [Candidatus Omnitrophota bacterium]